VSMCKFNIFQAIFSPSFYRLKSVNLLMGKNSHILLTNISYRRFSISRTFSDWQCFRRQESLDVAIFWTQLLLFKKIPIQHVFKHSPPPIPLVILGHWDF